ncbi:cyclin-dependent kinase inhibitor 5-like [Rhododendron vialii]|uniref:cyclin-dependent kinase inhibitor 5-like n=1 Tax=Rhododendron vialii TaxID=182163 RepID=UPI00265FDC65|nr:cyclin-dependent kinase inhibitor 5-like [Rhododendron vialii]
MGKYMKKAKTSGEVALMDSYLGVRTRAKTLALQKSGGGGGSYLQLRSRRLEKQTLICDSKRQKLTPKESPVSHPKNPNLVADEGTRLETEEKKREDVDEGIEASFGENVVEFEGRERSTRESTPCSLIRDPESIRTPGSTTRPTMPTEANRRLQNSMPRHIPTANEMDEFFAGAEEKQRRQFIEKYNFDLVNDAPLPGRYEWSKLDS